MAPDGTMIPSFHNWDYRTIESQDGSGRVTTVDGGVNPIYNINSNWPVTDMTVYSDDPFEVQRRFYCRKNVGKNRDKYATWIPLFLIDDEWLEEILKYFLERGIEDNVYAQLYFKEAAYRREHDISI